MLATYQGLREATDVPTEYNKLIRDQIPEIISASGRRYEVEEMSEGDYKQALLEKLVEEAYEARSADVREALVMELADLHEVMDATAAAFDIQDEEIAAEQVRRRHERGGFTRRLRLLWTD